MEGVVWSAIATGLREFAANRWTEPEFPQPWQVEGADIAPTRWGSSKQVPTNVQSNSPHLAAGPRVCGIPNTIDVSAEPRGRRME